jgi:hypothetical protein
MKNIFSIFIFIAAFNACSEINKVSILKNEQGMRLVVNGEDFMINGMNWDYYPIGTNYNYSLWEQTDNFIKSALDKEMSLLKDMGVNAIRVYVGIPPKWITYIYENYGIYTMLNHSFGRYGLTLDGIWNPVTDYSNLKVQKVLIEEVTEMSLTYRNTPGLLLFLIGNENNYGLFWSGAETEDFPDDENEKTKVGETNGRPMYKLMNEAAVQIKNIDNSHPVAICNGDLMYIDIIAQECKDIDIFGVNMYRGKSFFDAFERVQNELNLPIMFTEFGSDAFHAIENIEDQKSQADFLLENWKEIYENAAGLGKVGNSIGGFTFQFSDGWWKFKQTKNLFLHDTNASWASAGHNFDFTEGSNNMNEEWFGICAKGPTNDKGSYTLYPRAAYYILQQVHQLNLFQTSVTADSISEYFSEIQLSNAILKAKKNKDFLINN